jgi:uncharacterized protein involved in type VI secretion and phage assembly
LANGSRTSFTGFVNQAGMLAGSAGLVRYRIRLGSFLWPLGLCKNSHAWENKSAIEIVEAVLARYPSLADWRWSDDVGPFMAEARARNWCAQYRESDLDFLTRLLTEEGVAWRVEDNEGPPAPTTATPSCRWKRSTRAAGTGARSTVRPGTRFLSPLSRHAPAGARRYSLPVRH